MAGARGRRYARAIFELAEEEKDLAAWTERIAAVREVFQGDQLRDVLKNPTLPPAERVRLMEDVLQKRLDEGALNLARLLVSNAAINAIDDIAEAYSKLVDDAEGRVRATAVAAVELPAREWQQIAKQLSSQLGKEVKLEVRVDPRVIGGVLFEIGDSVIDATVAGRLQQLRRALVSSSHSEEVRAGT